MPFYKDFSNEAATILFWKYDENDDFDREKLIEEENWDRVEHYHPKKLAEYLMIRQLLKMKLPNHKILYKTIGQPYLFPKDNYISITHSFPFAALAFSKKRIGIDLEKIMSKIHRIKHKFLHPSEEHWTANEHETEFLTVIWVIKEALYKLHPSKYWSLKKHYEVEPFTLDELSKVRCRVFDDEFEDCYVAQVCKIEDFYFAIVEENHQFNYRIPSGNIF